MWYMNADKNREDALQFYYVYVILSICAQGQRQTGRSVFPSFLCIVSVALGYVVRSRIVVRCYFHFDINLVVGLSLLVVLAFCLFYGAYYPHYNMLCLCLCFCVSVTVTSPSHRSNRNPTQCLHINSERTRNGAIEADFITRSSKYGKMWNLMASSITWKSKYLYMDTYRADIIYQLNRSNRHTWALVMSI